MSVKENKQLITNGFIRTTNKSISSPTKTQKMFTYLITVSRYDKWIAGVIVFRIIDENIEFLLVQSEQSDEFTPPEGFVSDNESPLMRTTAINKVTPMYDRTDLEIPATESITPETDDDVRRNYYIGRLQNGSKPPILDDRLGFEWFTLNEALEIVRDYQVQAAILDAHGVILNLYNVAQ